MCAPVKIISAAILKDVTVTQSQFLAFRLLPAMRLAYLSGLSDCARTDAYCAFRIHHGLRTADGPTVIEVIS
jgi:hypothetical protein